MNHARRLTVLCLIALPVAAAVADDAGFLREGDLWVCAGDSITHADTYRRILQRVAAHYHPQAGLRFVQVGQSGTPASAAASQIAGAARQGQPTVFSLMTGMNNSINSSWRKGLPMDGPLAEYRKALAAFVQSAKDKGGSPVLLSPTLTDESLGWGSMWELAGTAEFLRRAGRIAQEVAQAEGAFYFPAAEEFEAFQETLAPEQVLRPDGVHPAALGQYQIARAILRRMGLHAGFGSGQRKLAEPPQDLPVQVALAGRFLNPAERKVPFLLKTAAPLTATATWSFGETRGSEALKLTGTDEWAIELPPNALSLPAGGAADLVLELTDGTRRSLYIVDFCRTAVLHPGDGAVSGVIQGAPDRPEGPKAVQWTLRAAGGQLTLEAEVFDSEIRSDSDWPWGQDGLAVWLDCRPPQRFADIGLDSEVFMSLLPAREKPAFAVSLRPWLGRGMEHVAIVAGRRTPTGYACTMSLRDGEGQMQRFSKHTSLGLEQRELLGFSLVHNDLDSPPGGKGRARTAFSPLQKTDYAHDKYGNTFVIVDLKGKLPGDSVVNAHLAKLLP